jgi:hypothetical protein
MSVSTKTIVKVLGVVTAAAAGALAVKEARKRLDASRSPIGPISSVSSTARRAAAAASRRRSET